MTRPTPSQPRRQAGRRATAAAGGADPRTAARDPRTGAPRTAARRSAAGIRAQTVAELTLAEKALVARRRGDPTGLTLGDKARAARIQTGRAGTRRLARPRPATAPVRPARPAGGKAIRKGWRPSPPAVLAAVGLALITALVVVHHSGEPAADAAGTQVNATPAASVSVAPARTKPGGKEAAARPAVPVRWTTTTVAIKSGGMQRSYLLAEPSNAGFGGKLPVMVFLHGHSVTPIQEFQRGDFTSVTGPAILVYPAGYQMSWNAGACCLPAQTAGINDVGFVKSVLADVLSKVPSADSSRVYLAGYSNGGKLALTLACDDPGAWRAVAVYGATDVASCPHRPSLPIEMVASTSDPELTISADGTPHTSGSFVQPTVAGEVDSWRQADGCATASTTTRSGNETQQTWKSCRHGERVSEVLYSGGDHTWPTGGSSPSGAEVMWSFFTALGA